MLDPRISPEQKIALANEMFEHGQKSFKGPDGRQYQITEANVGGRKLVGVFENDAHGHSHIALRGIVEKDGHVSKQTDSKGRPVDYESNWSKKNPGTFYIPGTGDLPEGASKGVDAKDNSKYERKPDGKGGFIETHSGEKPQQNYIKTDDGHGNTIVRYADKTGYSRSQDASGRFSEVHFGPKQSDKFKISGDGKGNNVETCVDEKGTVIEKHTSSSDPQKNFIRTVDRDNNKVTSYNDGEIFIFEGKDGRGYTRTTDRTTGAYTETHRGPNEEDYYTVKGDGKGHEIRVKEELDR